MPLLIHEDVGLTTFFKPSKNAAVVCGHQITKVITN